MVIALSNSYSLTSGTDLYAGIEGPGPDVIRAPAFGVSNIAAAIGDSNMQHAFRSTILYWLLGRVGAPFELVANSGKSGVTTAGLTTQIDQLYTNASNPGLAGLPALGWLFVQSGTNGWRGVTSITPTIESEWAAWITKCKTYAEHIVIITTPPAGGVNTAKAAGYQTLKTYFGEFVQADTSGRTHLIDPWTDMIDNDGNIIPEMWLVDEYHHSAAGAYRAGLTAQTQMQALLANQAYSRAPLVTNSSDVYPTQPQWISNPTLVGTGGTAGGGWSGVVPTGWQVDTNGSGMAGTVSIVAADIDDSNQVPWMRITPSLTSTSNIRIRIPASGRTLTELDPGTLEQLIEVRLNALFNFREMEFWMQIASGQSIVNTGYLQLPAVSGANGINVLRQKYMRVNGALTAGGTPTAYIYIKGAGVASGSMGSIDIRCPSVRG